MLAEVTILLVLLVLLLFLISGLTVFVMITINEYKMYRDERWHRRRDRDSRRETG